MKNFSKNLLQVYIINYLIFYRIQLFQKKPQILNYLIEKVLNELKRFKEQNPFFVGIVPWLGFKSEGILFDRPNRELGVTGWSLRKMLNFFN